VTRLQWKAERRFCPILNRIGFTNLVKKRTGVKRNYHTLENQGKANEQRLAEFLSKHGQQILPMVELISQSRMAIDELVDVMGR
jgi:hypothetical protein